MSHGSQYLPGSSSAIPLGVVVGVVQPESVTEFVRGELGGQAARVEPEARQPVVPVAHAEVDRAQAAGAAILHGVVDHDHAIEVLERGTLIGRNRLEAFHDALPPIGRRLETTGRPHQLGGPERRAYPPDNGVADDGRPVVRDVVKVIHEVPVARARDPEELVNLGIEAGGNRTDVRQLALDYEPAVRRGGRGQRWVAGPPDARAGPGTAGRERAGRAQAESQARSEWIDAVSCAVTSLSPWLPLAIGESDRHGADNEHRGCRRCSGIRACNEYNAGEASSRTRSRFRWRSEAFALSHAAVRGFRRCRFALAGARAVGRPPPRCARRWA